MRSLAAVLLTLYLLRLPLVTCISIDLDDNNASSNGDLMNHALSRPQGTTGSESLHSFLENVARHASIPCRLHQQNRELVQYLIELAKEVSARANNLPCEHKRNSEIINSLLGLPKVMSDGGRK